MKLMILVLIATVGFTLQPVFAKPIKAGKKARAVASANVKAMNCILQKVEGEDMLATGHAKIAGNEKAIEVKFEQTVSAKDRKSSLVLKMSEEAERGEAGWIGVVRTVLNESYVRNDGVQGSSKLLTLDLRQDQLAGKKLIDRTYALRSVNFQMDGVGEVTLACDWEL